VQGNFLFRGQDLVVVGAEDVSSCDTREALVERIALKKGRCFFVSDSWRVSEWEKSLIAHSLP